VAKGPDAFRTISEAADELNVPQHVLRFWETKFSFIRPMKRAGGRRFYRPQDIEILRGVRTLLHDDGLTIKGVQKLHKDEGVQRVLAAASGAGVSVRPATTPAAIQAKLPAPHVAPGKLDADKRRRLEDALDDLLTAKSRLDALLAR